MAKAESGKQAILTQAPTTSRHPEFVLKLRESNTITEGELRSVVEDVAKRVAKLEEGEVVTQELLEKTISL